MHPDLPGRGVLVDIAVHPVGPWTKPARHARSAPAYACAGLQCVADPMDELRIRRILGRGCRPALRILQPVRQPASASPHHVGRNAADGHRRRDRYVVWTNRRCSARRHSEERRERLHHAVADAARDHLRGDRDVHARGPRARHAPPAWNPEEEPAFAHDAGSGCHRGAPDVTMPALEVKGLHRLFGGLPAVRDVSMQVSAGERRLLLGPNGAGKTTLFNLIAGDFPPSRCEIRIFGENVTRKTAEQRTHLGMSRTYQIITLFANNTLLHNVVISVMGLLKLRFNPLSDVRRQKALWDQARATLALVGLEHLAD